VTFVAKARSPVDHTDISRPQRRKAVGRTYAGLTVCFKECNEKAIYEKAIREKVICEPA
jgi:hypothetical protein